MHTKFGRLSGHVHASSKTEAEKVCFALAGSPFLVKALRPDVSGRIGRVRLSRGRSRIAAEQKETLREIMQGGRCCLHEAAGDMATYQNLTHSGLSLHRVFGVGSATESGYQSVFAVFEVFVPLILVVVG